MEKPFLCLVVLTFSIFIQGQAYAGVKGSESIEQFCADREDPTFIKNLSHEFLSRISFRNQGGLKKGGVCWWHSRFQRNVLYLTLYAPAEKRPTDDEAKKIIKNIRSGSQIVVIPGFSSFYEFSAIYSSFIQDELERWQKMDGIARFNWVNGLIGFEESSAKAMKKKMDELYEYVEVKGNIAYQKLQIKGLIAHAWLVLNMKKEDNGYILEIIDSNFPLQTSGYFYKEGQVNFEHPSYGKFNPYLERKNEMENISLKIMKLCHPEKYNEQIEAVDSNILNNDEL